MRAWLDAIRPELILIEGPSDAESLIPVLTDPESEPPIAILAYSTDSQPQSCMWPFVRYSPEYEALRWAREYRVKAAFVDWPSRTALGAARQASAGARTALSAHGPEAPPEPPADEAVRGSDPARPPIPDPPPADSENRHQALADRFGLRHFNEFWDAWFETPSYNPARFREAMNAFADYIAPATDRDPESALRDRVMAEAIEAAIQAGTAPDRIVAVLGAAHVAAIVRGDPRVDSPLPPPVPSALAVVPYSYPRLSESSGYGAGNRAPWYYERVYQNALDFNQASLVVLIEFASSMHLRGFAVSLADVIEAYRLGVTLAGLRGKSAPGADELAEAACAAITRGEQTPIREFLAPLMIGRRVGRLGSAAGRNSLQREFAEGLRKFGFPQRDEMETVTLRLADSTQSAASLFLHRLRVAEVPYAGYAGSQSVVSKGKQAEDEAGGYGALTRVREHWEVQWTPATEVALAERVIYGESFAEVCERKLNEAIQEAKHAAQATRLLVDAVLTEAMKATARSLDAAERLSSTDEDVGSLSQAARTLAGLKSFGTSRPQLTQLAGTVDRLLVGTFTRATLRLPLSLLGDSEATAPARQAMVILQELALVQPGLDRAAWFASLRDIAGDESIEPTAAGTAAALLYMARESTDEQLRALLDRRLCDTVTPARSADFLAGFFSVNALVLLKNRDIVAALSAFLSGLGADAFRDTLPALRRAFSVLGSSERRFLLEHLLALHGSTAKAETAQVLTAPDKATLSDLGKTLSDALEDLNDLL
ncbi:MAG: hypothetical protein C5B50_11850 [Verrucomicrobia bacterium]|nr:MAG: hypothetical protein C5B50_11850 [Verrucomicrobiota bacterium]